MNNKEKGEQNEERSNNKGKMMQMKKLKINRDSSKMIKIIEIDLHSRRK
jgi:hypothetical protein